MSSNLLAVQFTTNEIRTALLNSDKEILMASSAPLEIDLNSNPGQEAYDEQFFQQLNNSVMTVLKNKEIEFEKCAVLLDSSYVFMTVIPVDFSEENRAINSQILWEMSNYFPHNYKDFKVNFYKFKSDQLPVNVRNTLIIGVNNNKHELIRSVLKGIDINFSFMDIDHFSAEKCLRNLYPECFDGKFSIVVGCKKSRLDFSLIDSKDIYYFDYSSIDEYNFAGRFRTSLEKLISENYLVHPDKIFLYGDSNISKISDIITKDFSELQLELANPFGFINHTAIDSEGFDLKLESCKYTPIAGTIFGKT